MEEGLPDPSLEEELFGGAALPPPLDWGVPPHPPPGLERLLRGLGPLLGGGGLSGETRRGLRQAGEGLARRREAWLRWESLERGLRDLLRDPRGLPHTVLVQLEGAWASAETRLGGTPCAPLLDPPSDPSPLAARLLPALERRLGEKAEELGSYYFGGEGAAGGPPKNRPPRPPGGVAEGLEAQRLRLARARGRERLLRDHLERLRAAYPQAVGRCGALLGVAMGLRGAQRGLEEQQSRYLEAKGAAMLLKARLEEVTLLLETYPPPTLRAHRRIRMGLEEAREGAELEAGLARAEEGAAAALGPAFRALAGEYGRLRERIGQRRWALGQLRPPPP